MAVLAVVAVIATLSATTAHARTDREPGARLGAAAGTAGAYRSIVADDNFRTHYEQYKRQFPPPRFNWGNDGCSGPAKLTGYNDNFFWPCVQHDFGYRNNRIASQHNEGTREFVDRQFLRHMRQICDRYDSALIKRGAKVACYGAADAFYHAVRVGAKSSWN
jgi:hypothetical protein